MRHLISMRAVTIGLAVLACGAKLTLALLTLGTNDVLTWEDFLAFSREHGGIAVYQNQTGPWFFNHPPFMLHALEALGNISTLTGVSFPFWLRLPSILADSGSLLLVAALVSARRPSLPGERFGLALLLMAIAPISIMVSGFHGNTDPVMIFFVLLSIYLLEVKGNIWLAGAAFGMALNVKVVPLILMPTMAFYLWSTGAAYVRLGGVGRLTRMTPLLRLAGYFVMAAVVVIVGSLPYLVQDPGMIALHVLGYSGTYGGWGVPRVLQGVFPNTWVPDFYELWGRVVVLMLAVPLAHIIQRPRTRPALLLQCGVIMSFFMTFTPGFGIQYLVWLVPWVVALGVWPSALYFLTSGLFGFVVYNQWSSGLPWYFADARQAEWTGPMIWFGLLCWASVVIILWLMIRRALSYQVLDSGSIRGAHQPERAAL